LSHDFIVRCTYTVCKFMNFRCNKRKHEICIPINRSPISSSDISTVLLIRHANISTFSINCCLLLVDWKQRTVNMPWVWDYHVLLQHVYLMQTKWKCLTHPVHYSVTDFLTGFKMVIPSSTFLIEVTRQDELATPITKDIFGNRTPVPVNSVTDLRLPYVMIKKTSAMICFLTKYYKWLEVNMRVY
jgi:hypothetical protein